MASELGARSEMLSGRASAFRALWAFGVGSLRGVLAVVADRPGRDRRYAVGSSKLRGELGWRPAHADFEAGLRETIAWYCDNEAWWADAAREAEEMYARRGA